MTWQTYLPYVLVMAGVTYLIRMLPLTVYRKQIKSRFVRSFLYYVPYAVLTAMTIPDVVYSTGFGPASQDALWTALAGLVVALVMAWRGRSLLAVAVGACVAVAAAQGVMLLL